MEGKPTLSISIVELAKSKDFVRVEMKVNDKVWIQQGEKHFVAKVLASNLLAVLNGGPNYSDPIPEDEIQKEEEKSGLIFVD